MSLTERPTDAPVATADLFRSLFRWSTSSVAYLDGTATCGEGRPYVRPTARHRLAWRLSGGIAWTEHANDRPNGFPVSATLHPDTNPPSFTLHRYENRDEWAEGPAAGPAWRLWLDWSDEWNGSRYESAWSGMSDAARAQVYAAACAGALAFLADDSTDDERAAALAKWRRDALDRLDRTRAELDALRADLDAIADAVGAVTVGDPLPAVPHVIVPRVERAR